MKANSSKHLCIIEHIKCYGKHKLSLGCLYSVKLCADEFN